MEGQKKSRSVVWVVIALVVAVATYGAFKYVKRNNTIVDNTINLPQATPTPTPTPVPATPAPKPISSTYKNGNYSASGFYNSPGGTEQINVSVTLKDGVITDATVTSLARRSEARFYQGEFISGFSSYVVGKSIDNVVLSKVSGSSLTPRGWNNAIAQIKVQAKA